MVDSDKLIYVKEWKKLQDKAHAFLGNCPVFYRWSIKYYHWNLSFHICSGCAECLYPTWLSLPSPYQCPLKPSFPVGSQWNWIKDMAQGLLGPGLGPARAQRASLDTSPSIKNQTDSRTHSIPTAERNNVPAAKAGDFYFSSRNTRAVAETRGWLRYCFQLWEHFHHKQWNNGHRLPCSRSVG